MRTIALLSLLALLLSAMPALAQAGGGMPAAQPPAEGPPAGDEELAEMMRQMGMDEEAILFMQLMTREDLDPAQMLLMMAMMGNGHMDENFLFLMLLSKALNSKGAQQPAVVTQGDKLYVIDDGAVHCINLATMELEGSVTYKQRRQATGLMETLAPVMQQAREKAITTSCQSNIKQLCLAVLMYAQDWDETLPGPEWVNEIMPYIKNEAVFVCPAQPDLTVGYAFNEALLGALLGDIPMPAETIILFDSDLGDEAPVGGSEALPEEGRHNGGVNVGFADGHVKWMSLEEARRLLEQPVE